MLSTLKIQAHIDIDQSNAFALGKDLITMPFGMHLPKSIMLMQMNWLRYSWWNFYIMVDLSFVAIKHRIQSVFFIVGTIKGVLMPMLT